MAETEALKNMVLSFRVSELQMLLGFAGRNKSGRKTELQARAVELLRLRSAPVQMKIKDLYKSIQQSHASGMIMQQQQQQQQQSASSSSTSSTRELQSVHSSTMPQHTTQQQQQPQQQPQQQQQQSAVYAQGGYTAQAAAPPRRMYPSNMYYQPKASPPTTTSSSYPVHPDVRLKRLPFFEHVSELLKPSSLVPQGAQRLQECSYMFHLTPQQATDVASSRDLRPGSKMEFLIQVQMRFCLLETSCEQEDFFPPGICVKVNGKMCPLPNPIPTNKPGVEPKRPPRPVNITPMVKLSPTVANHINVSWNAEYGRGYVITVNLVRKLTSSDLLQRLKNRGARHADFTRGLIKEKLAEDADCEIATTSLRVSLVCPLGKMRMTTPCRASTCYHLQCFDASVFLQMNERKPTWMCPVCDKPALYDNLVLDSYFQQVLTSGKLPLDGNEIQLLQDGSWSSLTIKKEQTRVVSPMQQDKAVVKIETLSDDLEVIATSEKEKEKEKEKEPKKNATVIDLTLSDSDDEVEADTNKSSTHNKPDSSNQSVGSTQHLSETSSGDGATQSNMGPSSVSSSGYISPSIITLDSPSPPVTPAGSPQVAQPVSAPAPQPSPVPVAQLSPQPQAAVAPPPPPQQQPQQQQQQQQQQPPPPPPAPQQTPLPGVSPGMRMCPPVFPNSMYLSSLPTFLDLDSDSNSPQSAAAAAAANANSMFPRY